MKSIKKSLGLALAFASLLATGSAIAQTAPTNVAQLASSVDFSSVGAGILAVAGTVIALYVIWKGAKFVISAVKGA